MLRCASSPPQTGLIAQLFGRGWSSAPRTAYTIDLYVAQLALTMDAVGFAKANICGLSMVRRAAPHRLILAGRPDLVYLCRDLPASRREAGHPRARRPHCRTSNLLAAELTPQTMAWTSLPGLRHFVSTQLLRTLILRMKAPEDPATAKSLQLTVERVPTLQVREGRATSLIVQAALLPGYVRAVISSLSEGPISHQQAEYAALASTDVPVLIIHVRRAAELALTWAGHRRPHRALPPHLVRDSGASQLISQTTAGQDLTQGAARHAVQGAPRPSRLVSA